MNTPLNDALPDYPVATLRVTHKGYSVKLSTYVAYALPEGMHDVYVKPKSANTPESSAAQGAMGDDFEPLRYDPITGHKRDDAEIEHLKSVRRSVAQPSDETAQPSSLAQQVEQAQSELSSWPQSRRDGCQLQGATAQPSAAVIQLALDRIDRVQKRDGGPLWHTAKDILKGDLDLIAEGLRNYEAAQPKVDLTDERAAFESHMEAAFFRDLQELTYDENGEYDDCDVQAQWQTWQARALLANTAQGNQSQDSDAARYRWMRHTFIDDELSWPDDVSDAKTGAQLDDAIDSALAAKKG